MQTISRSSKRHFKVTIRKPIRLVGGCVVVAVIALFVIHWIAAKKEEGFSIESSSNNKASVDSMVERNKASNGKKGIKSENGLNTEKSKRDGTEAAVMKRSVTPDELIFGMSQSELDAFHERQMLSISGTLSNPETKIKLPPSDDMLPAMTLHELDALHKQQTMAFEKGPIEFVQPSDGGTSEAKHAVMSLEELDLMHREQVIQSKLSANDLVNLPQISGENELRPLTAGQLDEMISRQQLAADFNEIDDKKPIVLPPSFDGPHTLTNWDLIELHSQQEKLIRE